MDVSPMETSKKPLHLRKILKRTLLAGVTVSTLSFFTADYLIDYFKADLVSRGMNPFDLRGHFSLAVEVAWYVSLSIALIVGLLAVTAWVMKKRPTFPKAAVSAPLAGLIAGCAGGALLSRTTFESLVGPYDLSFTPGIGVGGYISFLFKFTLFTGISAAVFTLFVTLFITVKRRFRVLFLLPALADVFFYHITTFPIVK